MYKTEQEIFSQHDALKKTFDHIMKNKSRIREFFSDNSFKSYTYTGCGSSFSLCKSAAISVNQKGLKSIAIPSGDLMINFDHYTKLLPGTLIIAPSRSGSTSEVINAIKKAKDKFNIKCMSICMKSDSALSKIADFNIELPWAFDESICQTRTVSNLYLANILITAIMTGDTEFIEEAKKAVDNQEKNMQQYKDVARQIGEITEWNKVVVLADSSLEGIAEEGSLAFKEICQLDSNYYHILDVRHGPMVMINNKSLVIVACSPSENSYQKDLIKDLKNKGAIVVTVSAEYHNIWGSDYNITVPRYKSFEVLGIPFIFVPQAVSFYKALSLGINPDLPQGLDPWIKL